MTKNEALTIIEEHNESIDNFVNGELKALLIVKNNTIDMTQWFKVQQIVNEKGFYKKGREKQMKIRESGFDCRINMQTNKLVLR